MNKINITIWLSILFISLVYFPLYSCGSADSTTSRSSDLPQDDLNENLDRSAIFPHHSPLGKGVGASPGRVVWSWDRKSVKWNGEGYWWELDHFDEPSIRKLVSDGIARLANQPDTKAGWQTLFAYNNQTRGRSGGYQAGQKIAIKTNINGAAEYDDDLHGLSKDSYTNPVVLKSLLVSLVEEAGVNPRDITVYDVTRIFPVYMQELCQAGVTRGVRFVSRTDAIPDESAPVVWSAHKSGVANYLPACVTEADYLINFANLKGHNYGITLCGKNHFGSFINDYRMRAPQQAGLHGNLTQRRMNIYSVLVDLMGNYQLGTKTMLYMFDALICPSENTVPISPHNSIWQQSPFNGDYTCSLFFSQDPVAIDGVGTDFLMNEPTVTGNNSALRNNATVENYLHEAALVGRSPSNTIYQDGNGHVLTNLGVHEHWNNVREKKYSRNFGKSEGIELILVDNNSD